MSSSTVATDPLDDDSSTQHPAPFKYDLRLEIGVKEEGVMVPVVAIFHDFVKHLKSAADDDSPVAVLTATDKLFIENKEMSADKFQKAFKVANTEGKNSRVMLGFKIRTLTKLSDLKTRMMHTYLIPHNLFLRQQAGGFAHGLKTYTYGFLKDDHPDHPDISILKQRFARIVFETWKKVPKEDQKRWRQEVPDVFLGNTGIIIPVNFTKEKISATLEGKGKITTSALTVVTPAKYGKLWKTLLDIALANKRLNNLIPFALNRENSEGYYYMVAHQARFMDSHRNIPITNIPPDANTRPGKQGATLLDVLHSHTCVQRVAYDLQANKYHVSTTATKYRELHHWITKTLDDHHFPYSPQIRPMRFGKATGNTTGVSYSDIFKDAMSHASESFTSNPVSTPPINPWKTRPPLAISYDINKAAFPALPRRKVPTFSSPSTTSETIDEDTIQSAISIAISKLEEQHREELAQLKQALVREESPLVTKIDHAHLQQDIGIMKAQLSALIQMLQQSRVVSTELLDDHASHSTPPATILAKKRSSTRNLKRKPSITPEKEPTQQQNLFTQDHSDSSASSSSVASMEGCEE